VEFLEADTASTPSRCSRTSTQAALECRNAWNVRIVVSHAFVKEEAKEGWVLQRETHVVASAFWTAGGRSGRWEARRVADLRFLEEICGEESEGRRRCFAGRYAGLSRANWWVRESGFGCLMYCFYTLNACLAVYNLKAAPTTLFEHELIYDYEQERC